MKTYSMDLRERVYVAYCEGLTTVAEIARTFHVSESFVYKLRRLDEAFGQVAPLPHGGGYPPVLDERRQGLLRQWIGERPDATLAELQERLQQEEKIRVALSTLSIVLNKLGLARKKKEPDRLRAQRGGAAGVQGTGPGPGGRGPGFCG